jgi:hypothetical protein
MNFNGYAYYPEAQYWQPAAGDYYGMHHMQGQPMQSQWPEETLQVQQQPNQMDPPTNMLGQMSIHEQSQQGLHEVSHPEQQQSHRQQVPGPPQQQQAPGPFSQQEQNPHNGIFNQRVC